MAALRQDIAKLGGTWHADIEWYSRAVGALMGLPITERRSWRYMAAIHGIDLDAGGWRTRGLVRDGEPLPTQAEQNEMWDQCQHSGWYFLPWHRGYLAAFESVIAWAIVQLGGPPGWKLPYWNYFDTSNPNARRFPAAFTEPFLPDGSPNALSWWARSSTLSLNTSLAGDITLAAMDLHAFTAEVGAGALGGSPTGFEQFGPDPSAGALELDPHNPVHVMVGGLGGIMSDPNYAALDPLFWLHHCNIDRLWAAWLTSSKNTQESSAAWADGPTPRQFRMPQPDGTLATFKPADCLPGGRLEPQYDDLRTGTGMAAPGAGMAAAAAQPPMPANLSSNPPPKPRLLGSNDERLTVGAERSGTTVHIAGNALAGAAGAGAGLPQRYFVVLQGIRGLSPSSALSVYLEPVSPPEGQAAPVFVKTVTLFGLNKASTAAHSAHAGGGLSVSVDATDAVHKVAGQGAAQLDKLRVLVEQPAAMRLGELTVDKVSLVSQKNL